MLTATSAGATPALRVQVDQKGDFVLIGNTLGYECAAGTPAPVVGTVGACGQANTLADSAPDIFWRSDSPQVGQVEANTGVTMANARSTAILTLPAGATVTHAFLYWAGVAAAADTDVTLERQGGFTQNVTAIQSFTSNYNNNVYQSVADVTALVQAQGNGAYRVSGVTTTSFVNLDQNVNFAGWWLVVLYQNPTDPPRNLALFDGFDPVAQGNNQNATLSGFIVPPGFGQAKLGVVAFEGDHTISGDNLQFDGVVLSNAQNPVDNFFNGTRSNLGAAVSVVGDLPQLTGGAQSMGGMDLDVVNVTPLLAAGKTSASIAATSTGDQYYLAGFVTSVPTSKPDFSTSSKAATDVNGGALLAGDQLEYTINVVNAGSDTSVDTVLTDDLPADVTFVPGSISIAGGPNSGAKTDAAGDDQCEYAAAQHRVTCRLGMGANAVQGGQISVNGSTAVKLKVTINLGVSGIVSNQAIVTAGGSQGGPVTDTPTDGNGPVGGQPPTDVVVEACLTDAQCAAPTPHCDSAPSPHVCVGCVTNDHCTPWLPTCQLATHTCTCVPAGSESCDGVDNDCDGSVDEGCSDADADGLGDVAELAVGSDPNDADTDDDGLLDGDELVPGGDFDGDLLINVLDPDSDDDGLFDGTEMGKDCGDPATDLAKGHCIPDADPLTLTSVAVADTDSGGVADGQEDKNHNGRVDPGETDPGLGHGEDDSWCLDDLACGALDSGMVCDVLVHDCIEGCRSPGNGCPSGLVCTSEDLTIGQCVTCVADAQCGDPQSGQVCNTVTHDCMSGCRTGGNGCPPPNVCKNDGNELGICVACLEDAQCGGVDSGRVCLLDDNTCVDGCHQPGNGCPPGSTCSSTDENTGTCHECEVLDPQCSSTGGGGAGAGGGGGSEPDRGGYKSFYDCAYVGGRSDGGWASLGLLLLLSAARLRRRWTR